MPSEGGVHTWRGSPFLGRGGMLDWPVENRVRNCGRGLGEESRQ